jgi:hypothetical protein
MDSFPEPVRDFGCFPVAAEHPTAVPIDAVKEDPGPFAKELLDAPYLTPVEPDG